MIPYCLDCGAEMLFIFAGAIVLEDELELTGICSECQEPATILYIYDEEESIARHQAKPEN